MIATLPNQFEAIPGTTSLAILRNQALNSGKTCDVSLHWNSCASYSVCLSTWASSKGKNPQGDLYIFLLNFMFKRISWDVTAGSVRHWKRNPWTMFQEICTQILCLKWKTSARRKKIFIFTDTKVPPTLTWQKKSLFFIVWDIFYLWPPCPSNFTLYTKRV